MCQPSNEMLKQMHFSSKPKKLEMPNQAVNNTDAKEFNWQSRQMIIQIWLSSWQTMPTHSEQ